jgi:hypothetical protein
VRRDADYFGDRELDLIYIAKRLREALRLEDVFTKAGVDYLIETDKYRGGVIFVSERVGVFFYVDAAALEPARDLMSNYGIAPWRDG